MMYLFKGKQYKYTDKNSQIYLLSTLSNTYMMVNNQHQY